MGKAQGKIRGSLWRNVCLVAHSEVIAHYARTRELLAYIEPSTPRGSTPRCSLQLAFSSPGSLQLAFFVFVSHFLFSHGQWSRVFLLLTLSLSAPQNLIPLRSTRPREAVTIAEFRGSSAQQSLRKKPPKSNQYQDAITIEQQHIPSETKSYHQCYTKTDRTGFAITFTARQYSIPQNP